MAGVALMLLAACGSSGTSNPPAKTFKIGLVTDTGGLNDKSFNHLADVGLEKAKTDLHVQGDVVESHSGDDYVPNLTNFASKNYDLVIGVGFLMATAVGTVSGQFPNIHFAIIDGAGTDASGNDLKHANVQSLFFSEQDAGAMVGVVAGMLEKQGKSKKTQHVISAVGGISIPPVNHYNDPAKCKNVANSQISAKSDIVFQVAGGCGLGALQAAGQAGVQSIGVDADQKDADPSVILSALKKVDVATFTAIKGVVDGKFAGGALTFNIANDGAGYAVDNFQMPADIQTELDSFKAKIKAGTLTPPADIPA
jgi:basic membrane protein A